MSRLVPRGDSNAGPSKPALSVAIPVLNGGERILAVLDALRAQEVDGEVELLLSDSGSTDGAVRAALRRHAGLRVFDVEGGFDHGRVRSALVAEARAPLVAMLSQDAVPRGRDYLNGLRGAFDDVAVVGAYARQVPRPGADPLVVATLARWTPPPAAVGSTPLASRLERGESFDDLAPADAMRRARFDNVGSMVRRSVVAGDLPFPPRPFGEDLAWGAAALRAGHTIAYVPTAMVEHHHDPTWAGTFRRDRVAHRQAAAEFGLRAVPSLGAAALALVTGLPVDLRDGGPLWAARGLPRRAAALLGQWAGGRNRGRS